MRQDRAPNLLSLFLVPTWVHHVGMPAHVNVVCWYPLFTWEAPLQLKKLFPIPVLGDVEESIITILGHDSDLVVKCHLSPSSSNYIIANLGGIALLQSSVCDDGICGLEGRGLACCHHVEWLAREHAYPKMMRFGLSMLP